MLCEYGCGNPARYTLKSGKNICCKAHTSCPAIKMRNSIGQKKTYSNGSRISGSENYNKLSQDIKDKIAWSRGKKFYTKEEILVKNSHNTNETIKKFLKENNLLEYKCNRCNISQWQNELLTLELDHIDGCNSNNELDNLRYLCPNCHSLTPTWRGRNINTGKPKVSDSEILEVYAITGNIRQTLLVLGLAAKGGNYERVKKLLP